MNDKISPIENSIFIIGINSFIGKELATFLRLSGYKVSGTYRNTLPSVSRDISLYRYSLGTDFPVSWFKDCKWVIYCSHDITIQPEEQLKAFEKISNLASNCKMNQIFLSSISSSSSTESNYGKTKFLIEQCFINHRSYIIRPGLVIGKGGLFLKMYNNILKYPITLLLGGGRAKIEYIGINDLKLSIKYLIEHSPEKKIYNLISDNKITLYQLAKSIRRNSNKYFIPIYIPISFIEAILTIVEFLKIPFPITKENITGFKINSSTVFESHINDFSTSSPTNFNSYLKNNME